MCKNNNLYGCKYIEKCCCCEKLITIFTQEDDNPEYYTNVYVECDCGQKVEFTLPVN